MRFVELGIARDGRDWSPLRRDFEVEGAGYFEASNDALVAPIEVVADASLTSLRHAIARYRRHVDDESDDGIDMLVSDDPAEMFDPDLAVYRSVRLRVAPERVRVVTEVATQDFLESSEPVIRLLRPLLVRRHAMLTSVTRSDSVRGASVEVEMEVASHGRTVRNALDLGEDVEYLLGAAFAAGRLRATAVADLVRTRHASVLVGQPEMSWLDAKSRPYKLDDLGRFNLARDIASFANAEGGLIIIGLSTGRVRGDDVITHVRPVALHDVSAAAYRAVSRDWLYPRPIGVRVDVTPCQPGAHHGVVLIEVPPQPLAVKPIFVRRAQLAGRVRTQHIALPVRVGDATAYLDLGELHGLIVAGRAALMGRQSSD